MLEHLNSSPIAPSRVVILGANGFVGGATRKILASQGIEILAPRRQELNLLDENADKKLAEILTPTDSLLIACGEVPTRNNKMLEHNISMITSVCTALESVSPAHVMYLSSDAVYADSKSPLNETSWAQPDSLHGIMHLAREVMLANTYNGPLGILRPTLIYGQNDPHNGYGPNRFRRLAAEGKDIVLFGEGEERRDHVLVDDVAELLVRMLTHKSQGVLNAGTGTVTSFKEIAEIVVSHFSSPPAIKSSPRKGAMPHDGYRPFDAAACKAAFVDFKFTELKDGLLKSHQNMVKNT